MINDSARTILHVVNYAINVVVVNADADVVVLNVSDRFFPSFNGHNPKRACITSDGKRGSVPSGTQGDTQPFLKFPDGCPDINARGERVVVASVTWRCWKTIRVAFRCGGYELVLIWGRAHYLPPHGVVAA